MNATPTLVGVFRFLSGTSGRLGLTYLKENEKTERSEVHSFGLCKATGSPKVILQIHP
jgi:hypothetical protein